jgi:hypothetical protein
MFNEHSAIKFRGLLCISKVLYFVTEQHHEPDESIPHRSNPFSALYYNFVLFLRVYLPSIFGYVVTKIVKFNVVLCHNC